jgi:hypothetical protein
VNEDRASRKAPRDAFVVPALAASFIVPVSWLSWRVAEWRARSFERFFGSATTYQALFFGTLVAFVLVIIIAPPCLWVLRALRFSIPVQICVGVTIAALVGAAVILLDPAFPKPIPSGTRFEGLLTGISSGAVFWFIRRRILLRHSYGSTP